MLIVDPSKCKRERTWGIKVYVGRYKDICESSGGKVIDHLSNFYVTWIVERIGPVAYRLDLSYEEQPVQILGREEKELRNKTIPLGKVLWRNHLVEEATWEWEDQMRSQYPHLFHNTCTNFVDKIFL